LTTIYFRYRYTRQTHSVEVSRLSNTRGENDVLGSFDNLPHNPAIEFPNGLPLSQVARKNPTKQIQSLDDLAKQDWAELPYAMMRLTANRMRWDDKHLYWRDRTLQLGEI